MFHLKEAGLGQRAAVEEHFCQIQAIPRIARAADDAAEFDSAGETTEAGGNGGFEEEVTEGERGAVDADLAGGAVADHGDQVPLGERAGDGRAIEVGAVMEDHPAGGGIDGVVEGEDGVVGPVERGGLAADVHDEEGGHGRAGEEIAGGDGVLGGEVAVEKVEAEEGLVAGAVGLEEGAVGGGADEVVVLTGLVLPAEDSTGGAIGFGVGAGLEPEGAVGGGDGDLGLGERWEGKDDEEAESEGEQCARAEWGEAVGSTHGGKGEGVGMSEVLSRGGFLSSRISHAML